MRPPTRPLDVPHGGRPSSKGSSLTSESSRKAEQGFPEASTRAARADRPESPGTEPPPSSSRTRVVRIAREKDAAEDDAPCSANMTMEAWAAMNAELGQAPHECVRTRLIGELTKLMREPEMPETTRTAGLTLIGWLARRMPGEEAHALGTSAAARTPREKREAGRGARGNVTNVSRAASPAVTERRPGKR